MIEFFYILLIVCIVGGILELGIKMNENIYK